MNEAVISRQLNLCGEVCPFNFVKTVLALEEMESGELLEVTLQGQEAIANVPRSVKQAGHTIVGVERLGDEKLLLRIKKG